MIKAVTVCAGFLEITSLPLGLSIQYTGEDFDFAEVVDSAALEGEKMAASASALRLLPSPAAAVNPQQRRLRSVSPSTRNSPIPSSSSSSPYCSTLAGCLLICFLSFFHFCVYVRKARCLMFPWVRFGSLSLVHGSFCHAYAVLEQMPKRI